MPNTPYLRLSLTGAVIQKLSRGESLNLYGEPGIGKTRLLEDIQKTKMNNTRVLSVSIHVYKGSYTGFCKAIWAEAGLEGSPPTSFPDVINAISNKYKRIFLFIDHFQSIVNNPDIDPAYNQQFIDTLNTFKNIKGVSLILVSIDPIDKFPLFVNKEPLTSVLYLNPVKTPKLSYEELLDELCRRDYKGIATNKIEQLASFLNDYDRNYTFLSYFDSNIKANADPHLVFKEKLSTWLMAFEKEQRPATIKQAVKAGKWLRKWLTVVPYDKVQAAVKGVFAGLSKIYKIIPWIK